MKIGEYEQMMSWLTRPEAPTPIEPRENFSEGRNPATDSKAKQNLLNRYLKNLPEGYQEDYIKFFLNDRGDGTFSKKASAEEGVVKMKEKYGDILKTQYPSRQTNKSGKKFLDARVIDINSAILQDLKSKGNIVSGLSDAKKVRDKDLQIVGDFKDKNTPKGKSVHHFLPLAGIEGESINLASTKNTAVIDKKLNSKMAPFDKKLKANQKEQINLLQEKPPGYERRMEELNYKAKNIYKEAGKKVPSSKGYLGYTQINVNPDGTYTNKVIGMDKNKSLAGLEGEEILYKNISKEDKNKVKNLIQEDITNVQKVIRKMQGQMNSGMDPKLLTEYLGAEMKDLAAFGSKYGGNVLSKVSKGITGIDLPIFQVMFGSMYDIEQDSPLWLTLPAAFTDEVSNVFKLYDKSKGRFGLGKAKDFGKFLASSFVPRVLRNPIFKGVSKIGKAGSFTAPVLELGKQVYLNEKRKGMLPDIARQFDIPIEKAREGYDNYIKQGQIRGMESMVDDMEIPEISKQGQDNLDSTINSFKQIGALLGLNKDPYAEKESIYTRGKETPMSLDRVLDPERKMFNQGSSVDDAVRSVDPERDSFKKISNVLGAYRRYRRGEKNPKISFSKFFELYSTENFAEGGRVNFRDGTKLLKIAKTGKKGLDYLKDFLKKKTVTVKRGESGTEGASSSFSDPDYKGKYYTPEGGGFGTAAEDARYYSKLGGDEGSPKVFTAELTPEEIKEGLRLRSLDSQDPEIGDIILPKSAEDKVKIDYLNTIRAKFEKYFNMAEGGRVNFADGPKDPSKKGIGSLSKRNFLKMLTLIPAGILALRGGPNLIKKVQKTAPVVKENLAGAPDHFWKIYNKIKEFGFDATKMYSFGPKDTKKYIKYKDYELTEDINTGEKTIQRMKPLDDDSASYYGNPLVEETYMSYRPGKGQMDETMKGKTPPDDYEEGTAYLRTDREYAGEVVDEMSGIADDIFEEAGVPVPEAIRKK